MLAGARAMLAGGSSHAPHLAAMSVERKALAEVFHRLDVSLAGVEAAEMDRLAEMAAEWAARTGGIAFDAPEDGELVERSRSLDARPFFLGGVRVAARGHLERHGRLEKDRADVRSFLDKSGQLLHDRDRLERTAPEDRIAADEEARAEAERRRLAEERALAALEAERLRLEEERDQERSEGGGISMS